jgi:hypothetical protein
MKDEELAIAGEEKQAVAAVLSGKYTMTGKRLSRLKLIWAAAPATTSLRRVQLPGPPATKNVRPDR